ncbi:MAG TPA: AAA family ATPase [Gaiellaceae bacterium]|nr:AAA family ATPase [Gaiellaceae bacterium]
MAEELRCAVCGRVASAGDRFCASCGARVDERGRDEERKLVSALCVDLVGYTSLSEALDPEDARRLLDAYWNGARAEIERFGGTAEKFIGDAVVGLFGARQAHEDDAARAVRAALAIRDRSREAGGPQVRVAVATGVALVDRAARPETGEPLVVGDVVTTATRLQQAAPPGAVVVDEATRSATGAAVRYRRLPPVAAKGKRRRVPVWRALGVRDRRVRPAPATRFVGRRHELDVLGALLGRVRDERTSGLVTVVGEPGIGKSRLVRELPAPGTARWETAVLPYGEGSAFSAIAGLVEERAGLRGRGEEGAAAALAEFVASLLPDPAERAIVERHARRLVGLEAGASADDALAAFAAWRRLFEAAAAREPLVLVVEDVHWADDALLDFLEHLVEWVAGVPLLVLCTARPELLRRRPGWGGGPANTLTLSLAPLSPEETGRLVADVLGREPDAGERAALVARAGGNPLYAEQLARMLRERGEVGARVPESLHAVIAARLDRLSPTAKALLQDASVAGLAFPAAVLVSLGSREPAAVAATLHELARVELVERRGGEDEWAFRHRLVREVAYGELPRAVRVDKHVLVARWLEQRRRPETDELVAHQYLRAREEAAAAGLPCEELAERARLALVAAAERALWLNAFASATRLYGQALDLWPAGEEGRARQLLRYAYALWNAEVSGEAVALEARDALVAAGDVDGAAEAEALLSEMRWYRGDRRAAGEHLARAVELAAPRPPSPAKARVLSRLARSQMLAARYADAVATGREALALAESLGLVELQAEALNSIGSARVRGGDEGGFAELERAIGVAGETRAAVVAWNNLSALRMEAGDLDGSDEAGRRSAELAERLGDRLHLEWFRAEEIGRRFDRAEWDELVADADEWLASPHHPVYPTIGVLAARGFVLHARDEPGALDDLRRAEQLSRAAGDPQTLAPTLAELAFALAEEGRAEEAAQAAGEALALCEETGDSAPLALFDLAVVCAGTGLEERLRTLVDAAVRTSCWTELARDYLDGRTDDALALLCDGRSAWIAARLRLRSAELGGPGLDEALAYYRSVGATRYVRRCEALAEGWRSGTTPLQPSASARSEVAGVTTVAEPRRGRGTRSA